jgi:hypothetical protein
MFDDRLWTVAQESYPAEAGDSALASLLADMDAGNAEDCVRTAESICEIIDFTTEQTAAWRERFAARCDELKRATGGITMTPEEAYQWYKARRAHAWNDPEFLLNYGRICFVLDKHAEAQLAFERVTALDRDFTTFDELDATVRRCAHNNEPFEMSPNSRKAIMYLGLIGENEDYVLDSAYSASDPEVLVLAGKYYLVAECADPLTSIGYFIKATRGMSIASPAVQECEDAWRVFLETRAMYHFPLEIEACVAGWTDHKLSLPR